MTVGSLFAGIGGFELAAQWAGFTPVWSNEIDPFCCKVLRKNFKHRIIEDDIRNIGAHNLETVDILTGGFPCQPFSIAGKTKGTADPRFLWPEMLRVAKEINPPVIVGENVAGLKDMGLDEILNDLDKSGYTAEVYNIPAEALLAPHKRERLWILAYTKCEGLQRYFTLRKNVCLNQESTQPINRNHYVFTGGEKLEGYSKYIRDGDGLSRGLDKHRVKALGNAIVPQIAFEIFKAIKTL